VTKLPRLYVVMLRYRVAAMVSMFLLLGGATVRGLELGPRFLWAALALASSYVSATALNDLADERIDKINHPLDAGRPLVEGTATRGDLWTLYAGAGALALVTAVPLGRRAVLLVAASLAVSHAYSMRPARLSYRTSWAPMVLGCGYVIVPFFLGVVAGGRPADSAPVVLLLGLYFLFVARIVLKDFRDRAGDARYGKPTLLLCRGKTATCAVSLVALVAADGFLAASVSTALIGIVQLFLAGIAWMLWRLWREDDARAEQVAIGIGARLGNGLLLSLLAWWMLEARGANTAETASFVAALAALVLGSSLALALRPEQVVIGYKG
jgi:4-hydroxybenzoate polyprenyltransferase